MRLQLHTPVGEMDLLLKITGEFNVYNVMAAVAIALAEQIDKKTIVDVLNGFDGVPGRFQLVEAGQPYTVIVDYAHTPDGLENVLKTARSITEGKLWVDLAAVVTVTIKKGLLWEGSLWSWQIGS